MNLYVLTQNEVSGDDTWNGVVVASVSADDAVIIHPSDFYLHDEG